MRRFKWPSSLMFLAILPALVLGGCVRTTISTPELSASISHNLERLALANRKPIRLSVAALDDQSRASAVGSQFLLFLLPFGRVYFQDLDSIVLQKAREKLTLHGYSPFLKTGSTGPARRVPAIRLTVKDTSLSAYDLFFVRRLKCELWLHGELVDRDGTLRRAWTAAASDSEYRRYGFEKELKSLFGKCLDSVLSEIIEELRL